MSLVADREQLAALFAAHGLADFKWIEPTQIKIEHWVRFRCQFGCDTYGKKGTCPPHVPSIEECRQLVSEYGSAAIFHFAKAQPKREERQAWIRETHRRLCRLEREVFLAGYYKAFLITLDCCPLCAECTGSREFCRHPELARPGADALGIDVFAAARSVGYPIEVLREYGETMNRYAFLLIE